MTARKLRPQLRDLQDLFQTEGRWYFWSKNYSRKMLPKYLIFIRGIHSFRNTTDRRLGWSKILFLVTLGHHNLRRTPHFIDKKEKGEEVVRTRLLLFLYLIYWQTRQRLQIVQEFIYFIEISSSRWHWHKTTGGSQFCEQTHLSLSMFPNEMLHICANGRVV